MRRLIPALAIALLTAGALTACTAGVGTSSPADFQEQSGRTVAASGSGGQAAPADRAIVRTGTLRLVAERPTAVADRIRSIVQEAGGRVARSKEDPSGRADAQLQLRIPAAAFDRTLAAIEREGDARDVSIDATDVTARVTDYGVRIANLRTSITRLRDLLAKADSSDALVKIESALTERQTSLEQLLAEQRDLADRVASATLTVWIVTPAAAPAKGPTDFVAAVATGAGSLAQAAVATVIAFGIVLPWLGVAGVLAGGALAVRRGLRRRARPTSA